ncbi:MAG: Rrf2 family transcriptional regulator [Clostridiales Family XIII bacterium]|jgi:Rrf2 family protein|nr:Rrf2 family transcriptional regulator [Clostridiales Family XIII bacterium]
MLISKECDYAVRIVREIANGGRRSASDIARNENIPGQFAYKILNKLEKSGIVRAFRGAAGGYELAKDTSAFSLYDVFCAIEGRLILTSCLQSGFNCPMNRGASPCCVHTEFVRLQEMLVAGLKEKTVSEVLDLT